MRSGARVEANYYPDNVSDGYHHYNQTLSITAEFYISRASGKKGDFEFYIEGFGRTQIAILNSTQRVEISPSLKFIYV